MIVFDLKCSSGHRFEGWFDDSQDYETQKQKGFLTCPVCNDSGISKAPSAFAIKSSSPRQPVAEVDALAAVGKKICEYVEKNFDDVGADFAKEALKMRFGVTEQRNIRGQSTREEEKMLEKEGVPFIKIPRADNFDT